LADAVCAGVAGSVNRAVDSLRLAADVLHDVDLAGLGPAYRLQVRAEHPEGGPDSLTGGQLQPCLDPPVGDLQAIARDQAGRGVGAGTIPADEVSSLRIDAAGRDRQIPFAVGRRVLRRP